MVIPIYFIIKNRLLIQFLRAQKKHPPTLQDFSVTFDPKELKVKRRRSYYQHPVFPQPYFPKVMTP